MGEIGKEVAEKMRDQFGVLWVGGGGGLWGFEVHCGSLDGFGFFDL